MRAPLASRLLLFFAVLVTVTACRNPGPSDDTARDDTGLCEPGCVNGPNYCDGDALVSCLFDEDTCEETLTSESCDEGDVCSAGQCRNECIDACTTVGARQCLGDGVQTCGDFNDDPCLEWGPTTACDDGLVCSNGYCATDCSDECTVVDATTCDGPGATRTCGNFDSDSCLEWGTPTNCGTDQTCSNGRCALDCSDECTTVGERTCTDTSGGFKVCGDYDADSCLEWATATACEGSEVCSDGYCEITCTSTCTDGQARCATASEGVQTCGDYNQDGCFEWGSTQACSEVQECDAGTCQALPAPGTLKINEVLYDGEGSDEDDVFIELWGDPGMALTGFALRHFNGANGNVVRTIQLSGVVPQDGYFVLATASAKPAVAAVTDLVTAGADLQNDSESLWLLWGETRVDALKWGSSSYVTGEGTPAVDVASGQSLGRDANHSDTDDNTTDFAAFDTATPGQANEAVVVNTPPQPALSATMSDLTVSVNASGSSDAESTTANLKVRFDFEDDGTFEVDWTNTKTAEFTYPQAGTYTVKVEVRDEGSLTANMTRIVVAEQPATPGFFHDGEAQCFAGNPTYVYHVISDPPVAETDGLLHVRSIGNNPYGPRPWELQIQMGPSTWQPLVSTHLSTGSWQEQDFVIPMATLNAARTAMGWISIRNPNIYSGYTGNCVEVDLTMNCAECFECPEGEQDLGIGCMPYDAPYDFTTLDHPNGQCGYSSSWREFGFPGVPEAATDGTLSLQYLGCGSSSITLQIETTNSGWVDLGSHSPAGNCSFGSATFTVPEAYLDNGVDANNALALRYKVNDTCAAGTGCASYNDPCLRKARLTFDTAE